MMIGLVNLCILANIVVNIANACIPIKSGGGGDVMITSTTMLSPPPTSSSSSTTTTTTPATTTTSLRPFSTSTSIVPISTTTSLATTTTTSSSTSTTSTTPTTTTTTAQCVQPVNTSAIYIPADSINLVEFQTQSKSECVCPNGIEFYFTTKNTSDTNVLFSMNQADLHITCANVCLCDINNNCYQYEDTFIPGINLYSYCDGANGCFMKAINLDDESLFNIVSGAEVNPGDQFETGTLTYKPITDPAFLSIVSASCSECPIVNSCML